MGRFWNLLAGAVLVAGSAQAEGFAVGDFTKLDVDTAAFQTGDFETLPNPRRLLVACLDCPRTAIVTLVLAEAEPDTESNLRKGIMSAEILQEVCDQAAGDVTCIDVKLVEVGDAVGWVTRTQSGDDRYLQTYELYLDGQKLNVQAVAESRDEADDIGSTTFATIVPRIVFGSEG